MKRKMVNIMTTMLLISNISINSVYASPVHLEPAPAPDMSITTEAENNSETTEETNEHNTSEMPDSNDGFHDGSEGISDDGNEGYGLLEEVGGGLEETSSYINLGILRLDSFLVKNMDGDYALKDYYAKIDEIIDYAKKKTKIKYFNSNSDENISNSLTKTLRGIEYDEEKNIFYMDLEKSDRDYDSTYSKKNRTNDEKLYRVYFKLNYVYDGKRTDDVDFNYIINDIKSKNEDEIADIKLVDDEFYGESGYNYLNVEITDKNGNKYKSKIIIETDQNQDYDQSGNINYDKPILTEEEIKNGQISNEHYNEIRDFIKSKDVFKPKNNYHIENSVLHLDDNYRYYISLTYGQYSKNFYLKTVKNEEQNIDLNNLIVDDEIHYLQDFDSIVNNSIYGYDYLRVKTVIDNGKKYNLISTQTNFLPLSSFVYRKYPNEKIINVDKKEKDNDIYLIFNLTNDKQYVLKLNKIDSLTIQDKQKNKYNINIKYNPNINEINEEGFSDAGTVEINKNLDARIYKEYEYAGPSIDEDTDNQIINSLKEKLNIVGKIIPKNYENAYLKYDKDKQKFYQEYSIKSTDKTYRFYFIGTNKDYEFSDENDTKLDLTDEKNIDIVLTFIKQEYDNVKDIKLNNKNILNENNRNYLDVEVTEDNGTKRNAKIFLNPTTIKSSSNYRSIDIGVAVSTEELSNRKLKKETINKINTTLNKKINNNILYKDEYFVLNDYNIYGTRYSPTEKYYINIYNIKHKINEQIHISIKRNLTADLLLGDKDNHYKIDINNFKVSEYKQCNKYNKNTIYISRNGEIPILDYINSKLNDNLYADNLRIERFLFDNKIIADVIDKTIHGQKSIFIINCNEFDDNGHKTFFMNTINDDQLKKDENGQFYANVTVYFDDDVYIKKEIEIAKSNVYYMGLPSPACPPEIRTSIIDYPKYPKYPKECQRTFRVIINPSLKTTYDLISCPNKPEKPNEIPKNEKPSVAITPSNLPKESPSELPKENEPKQSTPNKTIPNRNATSKPTEKTPNEVVEKTPITIISNEKKQSVNEKSREIENTTGLPNIERKEIKTGDNLFNIIYLIGTFGIFTYFIDLIKNKLRTS